MDTEIASFANSDDDGDGTHYTYDVVGGGDVDDAVEMVEPHMSQLGTPPKLSEDIDDEPLLNSSRFNNRSPLGNTHNESLEIGPENSEDGSGGGSSAASNAADIMRDMLNDLPRSNDTLVTDTININKLWLIKTCVHAFL